MSTSADGAEPTQSKSRVAWYLNPNWLLLIIVIAVGFWLFHLFTEKPASVHPALSGLRIARANLQTTGPNLLENPSFSQGLQGWILYYNAKPMELRPKKGGVGVEIGLNNVRTGVEEIYQFLKKPPTATVVASGRIRVSGAPLPTGTNAVVEFVDSSNNETTGFRITALNGIGTFPFAFAYTPNGAAHQFVLGIITGSISNEKTAVRFDKLKIAIAKHPTVGP
jgi:hypothetical protein